MADNGNDNDAVMLEEVGNALIDLEVKFRASALNDRIVLRSDLEKLLSSYGEYRLELLEEGVITTDVGPELDDCSVSVF